ncbi:ABC-F family ATP-binding cassette domain-containing protein [Roseospirillum parvum]|uniref:ATP-binding cassette, subfamily F, member 3 n=1 Tax=Roseospirillum parvum TaxID=83401 RepID=A0A1G7WR06_9PROT|nr:ABC-F family ATP-binding cassette domain-containing protein [Roseospirillum parvum]SDG74425.1 ATP-binding cassette, subfamily F, member 3 [Roseospirillum parvum]
MLDIRDLTYRIGGRLLLDGARARLPAGHRVGLVGRNGAGKSTLLALIRGDLAPESGAVEVPPRARLGWVAQEAPDGADSLLDTVLAADRERADLLARLDAEPDGPAVGEIHERLLAIDAHTAPARAARILVGLGFAPDQHGRAVGDFSGGWRMRVALAGALFTRPDLLLLDEPTNHLDLEATLWLTRHLASYPGTLLIVSHDRDLLNGACNHILHLEGGRLTLYGGNFDRFEETRRLRLEAEAKTQRKLEERRAHMQAFVDRFRAKATKARQAQSRLKMLEKLPPPAAIVEEQVPDLAFPEPDELAPPLIAIENGRVGYGDTVILDGLNLRIDQDDRIALLGANGNGKSTLAKLLVGALQPMAGEVRRSNRLRVGYFAQHQLDDLRAGETAFQHLARARPNLTPPKVRAHLGRFGFAQARADVIAANLSGGEKARLAIALMSLDAPHLLVLDEPTNHLDMDTRAELVRALNVYGGAVVLVSHDFHLLGLMADRLWLVGGGCVTPFDGDLADYRQLLLDGDKDKADKPDAAEPAQGTTRKDARRAAAEARAKTAPLRQAIKQAEKDIARLEKQKAELENQMADPDLYNQPAETITRLQQQLAETSRTLTETEEHWLTLSHDLETATG